jgi:tyrosine-protein kinase Etk/Wzc
MLPPTQAAGTNGLGSDDGLPPRIHLYDYLIKIARYRWLLLVLIVGGTVLIAVYSMLMPHVYPAAATLLPPDKAEGLSLVSFLNSGEGFDMSGLSQNSSSEIFVKILKSKTLADSLINRLDLWSVMGLDTSSREIAIMNVQSGFDISTDRHGMISINYNAATPFNPSKAEQHAAAELGAKMVNESIDILDRLNRQKMVTRARRTREFIGRMKDLKRLERDSAQNRLLVFQQRNNAIALDKQVEASISALVEIQSQIQMKELELQSALNDLTHDNKVIENMQSQIAQLKRQRASMESGQSGSDAFALSLRTIPDLARQYAILKLDLEVANEVYTFLEQQYNQEQVQEARDLPTVSVLDWATPSAFRSAPRRTVIVVVGFLVLSIGSLVLIFLIDAVRRYWRLNDSQKALELRAALGSKRRHRLEKTG